MAKHWTLHNPGATHRVIVTKSLPGQRWLELLTDADCSVEVCDSDEILSAAEIRERFGARCDAAIGQLTEDWSGELFADFAAAGGRAFSNYAVGYNNVDVAGATQAGIPVGNTPGVLTETTAEMAAALTLTAGRRAVEADRFMRDGKYHGWLPTMYMGKLFHGRTVGVVGCGRIGAAYARIMVEGFKMNLVYFDMRPNPELEAFVRDYSELLVAHGDAPVTVERAETLEDLLSRCEVVSLHTLLDDSTFHMIDRGHLELMREDAILVNTSRGPVIDEQALVAHCRKHPEFRAALDVFEQEPAMEPGLSELDNVVVVPHIASATTWTREGMATLAAANIVAMLRGQPMWQDADVKSFLEGKLPPYAPSIVNAAELDIPIWDPISKAS
jgi:hydroxypyruvate reductase 1